MLQGPEKLHPLAALSGISDPYRKARDRAAHAQWPHHNTQWPKHWARSLQLLSKHRTAIAILDAAISTNTFLIISGRRAFNSGEEQQQSCRGSPSHPWLARPTYRRSSKSPARDRPNAKSPALPSPSPLILLLLLTDPQSIDLTYTLDHDRARAGRFGAGGGAPWHADTRTR